MAVSASGELRASSPAMEPLSWRLDLKHTPRVGVVGTGVLILGGMGTAAGPVLDPLPACPEELLAVTDEERREGALVPAAEGQSHLPAAEGAPVWPAPVCGDTGSRCGGSGLAKAGGLSVCGRLGLRRKLGVCWGFGVRDPFL